MPPVDGAGAHFDIALVAQFLEHAIEALFGDLQNVEQFGDGEAWAAADKMQDAVMRAAKAVIFEQPVGVADEIPIGEEQEFDQVEHRLRFRLRRRRQAPPQPAGWVRRFFSVTKIPSAEFPNCMVQAEFHGP